MYAVINTGGKQYRAEVGNTFRVEKIPGELGSFVNFSKVLMFSDGQNVQIGCPLVENVSVTARIVEQARGPKIIVFKYKRRKRYRRKQGHRQAYTAIRIDRIAYPCSESKQPVTLETDTSPASAETELVQKPSAEFQEPSAIGASDTELIQKPSAEFQEPSAIGASDTELIQKPAAESQEPATVNSSEESATIGVSESSDK